MPKSRTADKERSPASGANLVTLILLVPESVFMRMVNESGLTTEHARALAEAYRDLKE